MASSKPTTAQIYQAVLDLKTQVETLIAETKAPIEELPYWVKPTGNIPAFSPKDSGDHEELRKRALWCVNWRGSAVYQGAFFDKAWEEVEKIKALTPQTVLTYRDGLYKNFWPETAIYKVLVGEIPLYAMGAPHKQGWEEDYSKPLDVKLSEYGSNAGQGASGEQEGD